MFAGLSRRIETLAIAARNVAAVIAFVFDGGGREYRVGAAARWKLAKQLRRNSRQPGSASTFMEQMTLAEGLLRVPREVQGAVAEFGCFKGLSSASLSLVCALTRRRLMVFDSFSGLPEPEETVHNIVDHAEVAYKKGDYAGSLDEVRGNIERFGDMSVVELIPGFFSDSLPGRPADERYVMIFEDADLPSSVRDVLRHAWHRLRPGCIFFCHEARDMEVVELFFDRAFWRESVGAEPPGLIGSGLGLPFSRIGSSLAYVRKTK